MGFEYVMYYVREGDKEQGKNNILQASNESTCEWKEWLRPQWSNDDSKTNVSEMCFYHFYNKTSIFSDIVLKEIIMKRCPTKLYCLAQMFG